MHMFKVALLLAAVAATAYSQALNCTLNPEATLHVRPEGEAERVAPFVVVCTGGITSASVPIDITVTPVSYTHLDVYKRQPLRGARAASPPGSACN